MPKITMILCNAFHPDVRVYKEAKYLVEHGHSVTILALDRKGEYKDNPVEDKDGIHVVRLCTRDERMSKKMQGSRFWRLFRYLVYVIWFYNFIKQVRGYLKDNPCDYLHCHDMDGITAGIFANRKRTPLIFDMHEIYEEQTQMRVKIRHFVRIALTWMQNRCCRIIAVHESQLAHMTSKNKSKVVMVPNYPDFTMYEGLDYKPAEKLRVSYIGVVRGQTGLFRLLFDACKDMDDVTIAIHGGGGGYAELKKMESDYKNVTVAGEYDGARDSARLYGNTDVLYVCYDKQKLKNIEPVKFFEALFTCTPIITYTEAYIGRFSVEKGTGFVTDIYNTDSIRACIRDLADHREKLDAVRKNIEKVRGMYNWQSVAARLGEIYPFS